MNQERVDELRQRLRELGYLDAGVDRFVLRGTSSSRGPLGVAARASVRVGLLGGVLLGPAAAIGVGARLPGLISGARDAAVMAVYLAVVFGLAATALSFVVMLATVAFARVGGGRFERRGPRAARAAGWITMLATLLYLTLWWRNASAGFGWSAPVWTASALLLAVAISLLLGHAQRIAAIAVLAAAAGPSAHLPPVGARSWRVILGGAALAFAGAAALLILAVPAAESSRSADHPPLTVRSVGISVRLLAIDGFDPAIFEELEQQLPNLKYALGGRRVRLASQDTSDPARAWTTIATGVAPEVHGVHAIETRTVAGLRGVIAAGGALRAVATATDLVRLTRPAVASRRERNAKTMWEVAEDAGLRTAVVNWWATWPAPSTGGIVVTDRAVLRLERGGSLDGELAPASVYETLRPRWADIRRGAQEAAAAAFPGQTETATILRRSAELDATIAAMAQHLSGGLDLFVIYLPGLDIAQNALLAASVRTLPPSAVAARVEGLRSYYPFLDRVIDPLIEPAERRNLLVVTQPGRVQTTRGGLFAIAAVTKEAVRADAAISWRTETIEPPVPSTPMDVAPTVWWMLGLPLSRELSGQAMTDLSYAPGTVDYYVETYGRPHAAPAAREGKPLDQEMIDRLRSLGYIK